MTLFDPKAGPKKSVNKALTLQFDGGSRGNPGPAGIGVTVADESGRPLYELGEYIGRCTSNQAEYRACAVGLRPPSLSARSGCK